MNITQLMTDLFGVYTPVMQDVYNEAGEYVGQVVASGMAGVDWVYVGSVVLFGACLLSVFKLLGVLLKNG